MSRSKYRVLVDGHTHEGKEVHKGDIVGANERIADRYPNVFERYVDESAADAAEATSGEALSTTEQTEH